MVGQVERAGGRHITLPLDTKNPLAIWRNAARLAALIRARARGHRARPLARAGLVRLARLPAHRGAFRHHLPRHLRRESAVQAALQRGDGAGEIVIAASRFIRRPDHRAARRAARPHPGHPARRRSGAFRPRRGARPTALARLARAWRLPDGAPTVVLLPGRLTALEGPGGADRRRWPAWRGATSAACWWAPTRAASATPRGWCARPQALGVADRLRLVGECDDMPAALMTVGRGGARLDRRPRRSAAW